MIPDDQGLELTGADAAARTAYQAALDQLRCFIGDPLALADRAAAASPGMPMAHALRAWLNLLATEPSGAAAAREACAAAAGLPATERERLHLEAAGLLSAGQWARSARVLEDLSVRYPRDLLALQVGHQLDFFTGDSRMLRDRIARALPHWDRGMPGYHAVLSMQAFGLEETGAYDRAERAGREAVELEPRDGWGWHAVAHVHEMRHEPAAGAQWLGNGSQNWAPGSFLATHNSWHLALFQLELDDTEAVLRIYDEAIGGTGSSLLLDLVDASAMLWRLHLRGIDVGPRWEALAGRWTAAGAPGRYVFNDFHMMMALVASGRTAQQSALLDALETAALGSDDNARFTREVGAAAVRALHAFGQGRHAEAAELLRGLRSSAHRFGGSHAQRDVIDLTLIAAAQRSGDSALAAALQHERQAHRPHRPTRRVLAA